MYKFLSFFVVLHTGCHVLNYFSFIKNYSDVIHDINLADTKEDITLQGFLLSSKNIELVTLYHFYSHIVLNCCHYGLFSNTKNKYVQENN